MSEEHNINRYRSLCIDISYTILQERAYDYINNLPA